MFCLLAPVIDFSYYVCITFIIYLIGKGDRLHGDNFVRNMEFRRIENARVNNVIIGWANDKLTLLYGWVKQATSK